MGGRSRSACSSSATTATGTASRKPYGYSLYLAPFIAVFGTAARHRDRGTPYAPGAAHGRLDPAAAHALSRSGGAARRSGRSTSPSYVYMYAFWIHTELFLALLMLLAFTAAVRFADTAETGLGLYSRSRSWASASSEKATYVALFAPIALVMFLEGAAHVAAGRDARRRRSRVLRRGGPPYLRYSDWHQVVALRRQGQALQSGQPDAIRRGNDGFPARPSSESTDLIDSTEHTGSTTSCSTGGVQRKPAAYTGMVVYPAARVAAHRGGADPAVQGTRRAGAVLAVVSACSPTSSSTPSCSPANYFGGGPTLRQPLICLQIAPAVLAIPVLVRDSGTGGRRSAAPAPAAPIGAASGCSSGRTIAHRAAAPTCSSSARSPIQRLLPFESDQDTVGYDRCRKREHHRRVTACQPVGG